MSQSELIEIFKIIKDNTDKYTENNNGIFINLTNINNITFQKLLRLVLCSVVLITTEIDMLLVILINLCHFI